MALYVSCMSRCLLAILGTVAHGWDFESRYACGICHDLLDGEQCEQFGACSAFNASTLEGGCQAVCPNSNRLWSERNQQLWFGGEPDVRVTKGFGTKPYDQIRVSIISQSGKPPGEAGFFDYSARFRYSWTGNFLHTAMKSVTPGTTATFNLGTQVQVKVPPQGAGVAGVLIADPCAYSKWVECTFESKHQVYTRTPALINSFVADSSTDFWGILGDNFYDRTGEITQDVYRHVSLAAKSKLFITIPGNHDYWVYGSPPGSKDKDQCGNGHMQFYAQDSKAAQAVGIGSHSTPFDFSVDPNAVSEGCKPANLNNFFWYTQIGNVGIIGQSGAYTLAEARPFMAEACTWLGQQRGIDVGLLVGHWDISGSGATEEMAMPAWYSEMSALPGCSKFRQDDMLKYVMGHTHCNTPHPHGDIGAGFMVAGFGMGGCGNYGIPILDTTQERVRMWYFDTSSTDLYNSVQACVQAKGWRSCTEHATLWLDSSLISRNSSSSSSNADMVVV